MVHIVCVCARASQEVRKYNGPEARAEQELCRRS